MFTDVRGVTELAPRIIRHDAVAIPPDERRVGIDRRISVCFRARAEIGARRRAAALRAVIFRGALALA